MIAGLAWAILLVVFACMLLLVLLNFRIAHLLKESGKRYPWTRVEAVALTVATFTLGAVLVLVVRVLFLEATTRVAPASIDPQAATVPAPEPVAAVDPDVLGNLGQALEATPIYADTNTKARIFYRAKAFEYLVVQEFKHPEWRKVLLQNGEFGYVQSGKVASLPYEVTKSDTKGRAPSTGARGDRLAHSSLNYVGTPYQWGGEDLERGVDSSGFVQQLFGAIGVELPRTAAEQVNHGKVVDRLENLQPGDRLYFWDPKRGKIGHTGIYLGNGYFSHASAAKGEVTTDLLGEEWLKTLAAARR